jgi:hypothetical protein
MGRRKERKLKVKVKKPWIYKTESDELAKIIRDTRDGRKDYLIPRDEAIRLYEAGKIHIDLTSSEGKRWTVYGTDGDYVRDRV